MISSLQKFSDVLKKYQKDERFSRHLDEFTNLDCYLGGRIDYYFDGRYSSYDSTDDIINACKQWNENFERWIQSLDRNNIKHDYDISDYKEDKTQMNRNTALGRNY